METLKPDYITLFRGFIFFTIFVVIALFEIKFPTTCLIYPRLKRWSVNILMMLIGNFLLHVFLSASLVGFAFYLGFNKAGLFNVIDIPLIFEIPMAVIILDLSVYLMHVMFHKVPILWKIHMVHHSDGDYDLTTGIRFHPFEIIVSYFIKALVILFTTPTPFAVLLFEVILNGMSLFTHANISLKDSLDKKLRTLIVTPDMHRIHHCMLKDETNSNFGFNLSIWDRIFRTYKQRSAEKDSIRIGLSHLVPIYGPVYTLMIPFIEEDGGYSCKIKWFGKKSKETEGDD